MAASVHTAARAILLEHYYVMVLPLQYLGAAPGDIVKTRCSSSSLTDSLSRQIALQTLDRGGILGTSMGNNT